MKIMIITFFIIAIGFILVFSSLSTNKLFKVNCQDLNKTNCTTDNDCICKERPCLGVTNKAYAACEEIKQKLEESMEECGGMCPPLTPLNSFMEWKPTCLNNNCVNAYVNESFICTLPNNCTKR